MKLKKVLNNIIPFEGYIAMTFWPWVFVRNDMKDKFDDTAERHETTHGLQQIETFFLGVVLTGILLIWGCGWWSLFALALYYEWYLLEWVIKSILAFFANKDGYYSISFEQEAFEHEKEFFYNDVRKHFEWFNYIFKLTKRPKHYES